MADMTWPKWTLSADIEIRNTKFFFLSSLEELKHNMTVVSFIG